MRAMLSRAMIFGALVAAPLLLPAPATAQARTGNERVVTVFGSDPCPTSASGDDIVVCVRRDENERFRIPEELREPVADPENESWARRVEAYENVGAVGTGSCSTVGGGGFTGCFAQDAQQARAERRQRADEAAEGPR